MKNISIAVVMTVFNRKEKTEKCISSILSEITDDSVSIDFYITDDNSTDGTVDLINSFKECSLDSNFIVLEGNGNLFWNKGMHLAYGAALKQNYDYYLWVNNDVEFYNGFLEGLINDYLSVRKYNRYSIICGPVHYKDKKELSYGGALNKSKINPYKRVMVKPIGNAQKCHCINGNCLLIPKETSDLIGNVDERYEHGFGDFDYGYKLIENGGQPYSASKYVGTCDRNKIDGTWKDASLPIKKRIELKNKPTGQPPYSHKIFLKKWYPKMWIYYYVKPYIGILFSSLINNIRK